MGLNYPMPTYQVLRSVLLNHFNHGENISIRSPTPRKAAIKFRDYPFSKSMKVYMEPSYLGNMEDDDSLNNSTGYRTIFEFTFSSSDVNAIRASRIVYENTRERYYYNVQVNLRFTAEKDEDPPEDGIYDDCLPPSLRVICNGKVVRLPLAGPCLQPGVEVSRPGRPLNITPYLKLYPCELNRVGIMCGDDSEDRKIVMSIDLVEEISPLTLLEKLKTPSSPKISTNEVISWIEKRFREIKLDRSDDEDVPAKIILVSLDCPLKKRRMKFPAIGKDCNHLQCFDAEAFLNRNKQRPTWQCPICLNSTYHCDILLNEYFQNVVDSDQLPPQCVEVQLFEDGTWKQYEQ